MTVPPNLVLLTVDALRADHLGAQGYGRETSPRLDAFGDRNCRWTTTIAPSSHTREAAPPILTGQWPETFAANGFQQVEGTLPVYLRERGYHTGAFHSNPYLSRAYGYDDGFDQFYDDLYLARHRFIALAQQALDKYVLRKGEYYARAPELNRRALDWLDSLDDDPFFLWNHYMDVHGPYHAPERHYAEQSLSADEAEDLYRKSWERPDEVTDVEQRLLVNSYDDEIRCFDEEIGRFLDELDQRGLLDSSLVVITADHGDVFGENGYYTHPRRLDDTLLHVPLLISTPEDHSGSVDAPVSTMDVAPTLATAAGVKTNQYPGEVLVDDGVASVNSDRRVFASVAPEDDDTVRRFAVRTSDYLLRQERTVASNEIINEQLRYVGDTTGDTAMDEVPAVDALRDTLASFARDRLDDLGETDIEPDAETTEEIDSRLESLGYK